MPTVCKKGMGILWVLGCLAGSMPEEVRADDGGLPFRDRENGTPSSQFGITIESRQLLVYPYYEYYRNNDAEYKPAELGFGQEADYRGRYRANEGLIFVGYGVNDRVAVEFEVATIRATQYRSAGDTSTFPAAFTESGLGDVEGQIRWRWAPETPMRPEVFSYFETTFPFQRDKKLIGTTNWEFAVGMGVIRGTRWGTLTARATAAFSTEGGGKAEPGEYAIEYLKRLSRSWRLVVLLEGTEDEVAFIHEFQWRPVRGVIVKLNSAYGLTSKAEDWAPEAGVMFAIR